MVAARKGENKSAIIKKLSAALRHVDKFVQENQPTIDNTGDENNQTRLVYMANSQFTFPKQFQEMEKNNGSMILLFDEVRHCSVKYKFTCIYI